MRWIVILAAIAMAGCQGKPLNELSYSELKAVANTIGKRCEAQGITRTSSEWNNCVRQETAREDASRSAAASRRHSRAYCVTNNAGGTLMTSCL